MTKRKLRESVRRNLTDDLRLSKYQGDERLRGHCYVASEAFFHLVGGKLAGYKPMTITHEGVVHWYLVGPDGVVDLTAEQFDTPVPYEHGRGRGFLTAEPSKRARILMRRVMNSDNSHQTAIARTKLSVPARFLDDEGLLVGRCLDFGCGHGVDAEILGMTKWDPYFHPSTDDVEPHAFDTVMCNYVLNVVTEDEEAGIIEIIESMLKPGGRAYIAVRRDSGEMDDNQQRMVKLDLPVVKETARFCIYETWSEA